MIGLPVTLHATDPRTGHRFLVHGLIRGLLHDCDGHIESILIEMIDGPLDGDLMALPAARCVNLHDFAEEEKTDET